MDAPVEGVYQLPPGFVEDKKDPLIDINLTDSTTELWLIQCPINQTRDFDGLEVSLKLNSDGHLGTFEGSSGKTYEAMSFKSQGPEAVVFVTSESEAKIAGKISRRVSLIHYPEPSELQKRNSLNLSQFQHSLAATSTLSGRRMSTPRSVRPSKSQRMSGNSTPSSRTKSSLSGPSENPKPPKRKRMDEQSHSAQDSGKGNSAVTSTGSFEHSEERKSSKKKKTEH